MFELAELGVAVDETDVHFGSLTDDSLTLLSTNGVADDGGVLLVLHQEHVEVLRVVDDEVLEARGVDELSGAVRTVTLVGHSLLALIATADGGIDTVGESPRGTNLLEFVTLMAGELLGALLDDGTANVRLGHC